MNIKDTLQKYSKTLDEKHGNNINHHCRNHSSKRHLNHIHGNHDKVSKKKTFEHKFRAHGSTPRYCNSDHLSKTKNQAGDMN